MLLAVVVMEPILETVGGGAVWVEMVVVELSSSHIIHKHLNTLHQQQ
jgi:hypothetical protein